MPVTIAVDRTAVTTPYSIGLTTFALPKKNREKFLRLTMIFFISKRPACEDGNP